MAALWPSQMQSPVACHHVAGGTAIWGWPHGVCANTTSFHFPSDTTNCQGFYGGGKRVGYKFSLAWWVRRWNLSYRSGCMTSFQNGSEQSIALKNVVLEPDERKKVKSLSHVQLFATPWTVAYQGPLSMGFSRQQYWSGLPFPSPGDLPDPGIEARFPALRADALPPEPPGKPGCPGFKSQLAHLLAVCPWASFFVCLCLRFSHLLTLDNNRTNWVSVYSASNPGKCYMSFK